VSARIALFMPFHGDQRYEYLWRRGRQEAD